MTTFILGNFHYLIFTLALLCLSALINLIISCAYTVITQFTVVSYFKMRVMIVSVLISYVVVFFPLSFSLSLSQMEVEQLLSLSGSALAQAVSAMLETPGLYVFSDILELPNVREVTFICPTRLSCV